MKNWMKGAIIGFLFIPLWFFLVGPILGTFASIFQLETLGRILVNSYLLPIVPMMIVQQKLEISTVSFIKTSILLWIFIGAFIGYLIDKWKGEIKEKRRNMAMAEKKVGSVRLRNIGSEIDRIGKWVKDPKTKRAVVVSLYIWVPLIIISAWVWRSYGPTYYSPIYYEKTYLNFMFHETKVKLTISGLLVTIPLVLLWYYASKDKSAVAGSIISFIWMSVLPLFSLSVRSHIDPILDLLLFLFPLVICYTYHKKGIIRFTPIGYFLALFFASITGIMGVFAGGLLGWVV